MKNNSNSLFETRMRLKMTQKDIADKLGVARNYVYLMESGRKPVTDTITQKLTELESCQVLATPSPPASPCRYPESCDLQLEFSQVRDELTSVDARLSAMTAQLETVTRLLGAALGSALPAQRDHNQTQPHKTHPHRAAG
jgi:transcriptional regulator with XRE-family HTH domain